MPSAATVRVPVPPRDILGNLETRRLAGRALGGRKPVTRATLIRWRETGGFPDPIRKVAAGELWDRREVVAWLREREG